MCLNAKAAAAAESSDVLIPCIRISMTEGKTEIPLGAASSHFEYAPIVKHTAEVSKQTCRHMLTTADQNQNSNAEKQKQITNCSFTKMKPIMNYI